MNKYTKTALSLLVIGCGGVESLRAAEQSNGLLSSAYNSATEATAQEDETQVWRDLNALVKERIAQRQALSEQLIEAVRESREDDVQALLDAGANPNAEKDEYTTAGSESWAFMEAWANSDAVTVKSGSTKILKLAAKNGDAGIVQKLVNAHAYVNAQGHDDKTALMLAKNADVVQILVDAQADVNLQEKRGKTALMQALFTLSPEDKLKKIDILLKAGANPNIRDAQGRTVFDLARRQGASEKEFNKMFAHYLAEQSQALLDTTPLYNVLIGNVQKFAN